MEDVLMCPKCFSWNTCPLPDCAREPEDLSKNLWICLDKEECYEIFEVTEEYVKWLKEQITID